MGLKIKKYNITGLNQIHTMKGTVCTFDIKVCIDWMISNKYLASNYWNLDDTN